MPWLELRIDSNRDDAPAIEDALVNCGALSVTLQDNADHPIFEPALGETPLWQNTRVVGLFDADIDTGAVYRQLQLPRDTAHSWNTLEDKDWEREWMAHYQPIQCGANLWICPSWIAPPQPEAVNLLLDPGLAFGTGTHPTTFLCMQWLSEQELAGRTAVDYGCGSGILGIAALLLGARSVIGVDIDPQALLATQDNAQRNGLAAERFLVFFPGKAPSTKHDVVLANILAGPLVELADTLEQHLNPQGLLCLSGILHTQADTVMSAYSDFVDFDPVRQREEWVCLTGRRKK